MIFKYLIKSWTKKIGLDVGFSHEIIMCIYWLIEDTELAIKNYEEFQLQGPTRIKNNFGEKYLRLYGILNAINIQKSVIIQLYEIFKLKDKKKISEKFNDLEIIKIRNRLGAHSLDYRIGKRKDYFRISQRTLRLENLGIRWIGKDDSQEFNLLELISEFKEQFNKHLHQSIHVIIDKQLDKNSKIYAELSNYLDLTKERIKGNLVFELDGNYTVAGNVGISPKKE